MDSNMILVMIDECGEEVELERYMLHMDLDEDELEVWKERKIRKAEEQYTEAQGFYFEDRRSWNAAIMADIREWF